MQNQNNNAGTPIIAKCRACGGPMRSPEVHNALSRYCKAYICNDCGTREAFEGFFWRSNAIAAGLLDSEIGITPTISDRDIVSYLIDVRCYTEQDAWDMVARGPYRMWMSAEHIAEMYAFLGITKNNS